MQPPHRQDPLFDVFELLDIRHFDVVGVVSQEVDGVGHHVLRQQRQQLVCGQRGRASEPLGTAGPGQGPQLMIGSIRSEEQIQSRCCTAEGGVLLQVLSADVDVLHQALAGVGPPLLHGVLGTQSEHGHVLQGQTQAAQAPVELLGETLAHLVALVLDGKTTAR